MGLRLKGMMTAPKGEITKQMLTDLDEGVKERA